MQIYLISETIQDMTTTTVENEYELLCDLSKGAIFNDFAEVICLLTAQARNRRTDRQTDGKAISIRTLAKNSGDKAGPDETPFRRLCYTRAEHPTICYLRQGETYAIRSVCFVCHFLRHLVYMSLLCPRPVGGGAGALSGDRRPSSVCMSDVAYIGSNSKTKRPRKTKLCTGVPQVTCDSRTNFQVKRSKVKVTGSISAAQRNVPIFRKRIKLRTSNLVRT